MTREWRDQPKLHGKFHPDFPDDVQVVAHDGYPRRVGRSSERIWVRISGVREDGAFAGRVLNKPHQLTTVSEGSEIIFVATAGEHLLMTTDAYLLDRPSWRITPCDQCGLDELFDPPSDLARALFPNMPADSMMASFTCFCGLCEGAHVVARADTPPDIVVQNRWWEFWRS
ncbi:MAG: hypothetical protein V3T86_03910 [Planctomycetota bacterium]